MQDPASQLSHAELEVLKDSHFYPHKHSASKKIEKILAQLYKRLHADTQANVETLIPEILSSTGKISRGENYLMFPYRVLDYPKILEKEDLLLFRTMVLWGDSISFHLILSGRFKTRYQSQILSQIQKLGPSAQLSLQDSPWHWRSKSEELRSTEALRTEEAKQILQNREFIKISYFYPLDRMQDTIKLGLEKWQIIKKLLSD